MKRLLLAALLSLGASATAMGSGHTGGADCAGAPAPVEYVTRKVTRYEPVTKTRKVKVIVCETKYKTEEYEYFVHVPEIKEEKRTEKYWVYETVQVPVTWKVQVPEYKKEKRTEKYWVYETVQVPYTEKVAIPQTEIRKEKRDFWVCTPKQVVEEVPVCRTVRVPVTVTDRCGNCYTRYVCQRVTETCKVTRTVMERKKETRDVEVPVVTYKYEERKGTRPECKLVEKTREVEVTLVSYKTEERKGTRPECRLVEKTRDCTVKVCTWKKEKKKGTRQVPYVERKEVEREEKYVEWVAKVVEEKVPVTPCVYHEWCGRKRGGLFRCR